MTQHGPEDEHERAAFERGADAAIDAVEEMVERGYARRRERAGPIRVSDDRARRLRVPAVWGRLGCHRRARVRELRAAHRAMGRGMTFDAAVRRLRCRGCGRKNVTPRLVDLPVHYNDDTGTIEHRLTHRTHCPACRWRAERSQQRKASRANRCAVCRTRMSSRRYCSDACRMQAWRRHTNGASPAAARTSAAVTDAAVTR